MKSCYKLGELIRNIDVKNKDLHCNNLRGLSMTKEFRPSTSNIVGTDLSKYKIVAQKQFACDFMSTIRVHKMPIAFNTGKEEILVSPAYAVFEVVDEKIILPEYLMMWFSRTEFDRYADFRSDAAIRGGFGWNELCETSISIPCITDQYKIVFEYQAITERIALKKKINDNLEATAQAIYRKTFVDDIDALNLPEYWFYYALDDIAKLSAGGDRPAVFSNFQTENCPIPIYSNGIENEGLYGFTDKAKIYEESVTVSARGTVGYVFLREEPYVPIVRLISVVPNQNYATAKYLYFALSSIDLHSTGTSQQQITVPDFKKRQILVPLNSVMEDFMSKVEPLFASIKQNKAEIRTLSALQSNFLTVLSR